MEPIPFDKRSGKIWFNGGPIDWSEVKIHVLSHGLHYASCVFEGERVYDGEIFKLEEHTERLFHSAARLGFEIPYDQSALNKACKVAMDDKPGAVLIEFPEDIAKHSTKAKMLPKLRKQRVKQMKKH